MQEMLAWTEAIVQGKPIDHFAVVTRFRALTNEHAAMIRKHTQQLEDHIFAHKLTCEGKERITEDDIYEQVRRYNMKIRRRHP